MASSLTARRRARAQRRLETDTAQTKAQKFAQLSKHSHAGFQAKPLEATTLQRPISDRHGYCLQINYDAAAGTLAVASGDTLMDIPDETATFHAAWS